MKRLPGKTSIDKPLEKTMPGKIIKKHAAIPVLVLTIAVIILIHNNVRSSSANCTFYLKDLYGQREHLNDVVISGNLQDRYHNNIFKIINGVPQIETHYYHHYKDIIPYQAFNGFSKIINGKEYKLWLYFSNKVIARIKYYDRSMVKSGKSKKPSYGEADIQTDITYEKHIGSSYSTANLDYYVITNIGDRIFFTVPTTEGYKGTNGIFEVISFSDNADFLLDSIMHGTIKVITKFSIDDIDEDNSGKDAPDIKSTIEVLGLQGVGDKLVLILRKGHVFIFRAYDSISGNKLGEVAIDGTTNSGINPGSSGDTSNSRVANTKLPSYSERYEAFVSGNTLNLCFRKNAPGDERRILTFEITDKNLKLTNIIDEVYTDGEIDKIYNIYHKDNKVYVILSLIESEEKSSIRYYSLRPKHLYIYVYENSRLSYKGELVTDMNQDNLFQLYAPYKGSGIVYDAYDRRLFEDIKIKGIRDDMQDDMQIE